MKKTFLVWITFLGNVICLPASNYQQMSDQLIDGLYIQEMDIYTRISNRYAKTLVINKIFNPTGEARESNFTTVLPENAFISSFVLKIDGKQYEAYVKEKEIAKKIYRLATEKGETAGHVAARDSNTFTVSINIESHAEAEFLLTYEELLERKHDMYELVLNIYPDQIINKLDVKVLINESRPLAFVKAPPVRSGNTVENYEDEYNDLAQINIIKRKIAIVEFHPDVDDQMKFGMKFKNKPLQGLAGQFIVQYDVQRDLYGGEVLVQDGYFVHFFAPVKLDPIRKHIVFVLDTSSSMSGHKIDQLKNAMSNIIEQLPSDDEISLIEFNTNVYVWNIMNREKTRIVFNDYQNPFSQSLLLPKPVVSNNFNKIYAKEVIKNFKVDGVTNIIGALDAALCLVKINKNDAKRNIQPVVVFLTDGDPVGGEFNTKENIYKIISKLNSENNAAPFYTLSFGEASDEKFLKKLSLKNFGFSKHIYEGTDVPVQLENFYKEISIPLLSNIKFEYSDTVDVTRREASIFFKGSEVVICGKYTNLEDPLETISIKGIGNKGQVLLIPSVEKSASSLERLCAYLTIRNKLEKREIIESDSEKSKLTKDVLDLSLKYSFVTDVTSLVVVKPNEIKHSSDPVPSLVPKMDPVTTRRPPPQTTKTPGYQSVKVSFSMLSVDRPAFDFIDWKNQFTSPNPKRDLKRNLPWLENVLTNKGVININGGNFEIGDGGLRVYEEKCSNTPLNTTGYCTLLKDCQQAHSHLKNFQIYKKYFCPISNKFVGVCCPKEKENDFTATLKKINF